MKGRQTLLDEIERETLDQEAPLAGALRKCVALGGYTHSVELRDWATGELRGYDPGAVETPAYRTVGALLKIDWASMAYHAKGQTISPTQLPDFARESVKEEMTLYQGVGELEAMLQQARDKGGYLHYTFARSTDLVAYMNIQNQREDTGQWIQTMYHEVSAVTIAGVLDRIRTTLTELVAEMRDGPADSEGMPSAQTAAQAVNVAVHGNRNRVRVSSAQGAGGAPAAVPEDTAWWKRWQAVSGLVAGLATLTGATFFVVQRLTS